MANPLFSPHHPAEEKPGRQSGEKCGLDKITHVEFRILSDSRETIRLVVHFQGWNEGRDGIKAKHSESDSESARG